MKTSNLIFWEAIAGLAGINNPEVRAEQVMRKWGRRVMTPDASREIIADLTSENFPAQLTGADARRIFQLNPKLVG